MATSSSAEDKQAVLKLCRPCPYPEWLLLELPDGRFGAFWHQGFEIDHATAVAQGKYRLACARISKSRDKVLAYMAKNRL